jgi:sugar lactone lactonase YvrE
VSTTVPVAISTGSGNAIATPLPAPIGYTSNLTVPIAQAAAGTTVTINAATSIPSTLPVLSHGRKVASVRLPQEISTNTVIFFDSIEPSAAITVGGQISASQGFPSGVLSSGTQYYLAFYDPTQPSPAWETISGPVTSSDGLTLTFSGATKSFTLQANQTYGLAIFSLASATATPPPAPATEAYIANNSGIEVVGAAGVATTLPIATTTFGLDDSGALYVTDLAPTPAPVGSGSPTPAPQPPTIAKYAAGSTTVAVSYTPSNPDGIFTSSSGAGAFAVFGGATNPNSGPTSETFDVWNAGATGGPSFSITEPINGVFFGLMAHDGTVYAPHVNPTNGTFQYDVYAPGSSTVTRTIMEQIVPAANQPYFTPNYAAIGPDGTLYVTEYTFEQPDPLAGLYVYKPDGTETFVATTSDANGPGPQGVDVDASGNVYVLNNNSGYQINNDYTIQNDDLHDVTVYSPYGASVLRHITGGFSGYPLAVASDGTAYLSSFDFNGDGVGVDATYAIAAGTTTATQIASIGSTSLVLYDGNRMTTGKRRSASLTSASLGHGGGGPRAHYAAIRRHMAALHH